MAWTTPKTWTAALVTVADLNTHIRDNENFLHTAHVARMYQAAALSHTSDTNQQLVTWDTTDYDTDGFAVLGSEWFVIPAGFSGYYRISGIISFTTNATGARQIRIKKNETYTVRVPNAVGTVLQVGPSAVGSGTAATALGLNWQGPLVAGDHVTVEGWQNSGGNLAYNIGIDSMSIEIGFLGS